MLLLPNNQTAEILYELIKTKIPLSFSQLHNLTAVVNLGQRISQLRRLGLQVYCKDVKTTNKHGRPILYGTWSVAGEEQKALEVYEKINKPKATAAKKRTLEMAIIPSGAKTQNELSSKRIKSEITQPTQSDITQEKLFG